MKGERRPKKEGEQPLTGVTASDPKATDELDESTAAPLAGNRIRECEVSETGKAAQVRTGELAPASGSYKCLQHDGEGITFRLSCRKGYAMPRCFVHGLVVWELTKIDSVEEE